MTSKAKELFPNHEVNSERIAEKLFDDIAKKILYQSLMRSLEWKILINGLHNQ